MEDIARGEDSGFKAQKQEYFFKLGLEMRSALRLHQAAGLWERVEGKRDWGNVSEHCLVETARVDVFNDWLGLSTDLKEDSRIATALSDYFKKREKAIRKKIDSEGGTEEDAFKESEAESSRLLNEAGFSPRVIELTGAAGTVASIKDRTPKILNKDKLSPEDIAYLVIHYVDDYTIGSRWVAPVEVLPEGRAVNEFDRRMDDLNARYPKSKAEGLLDLQRNVGHRVEERLAGLISERTGRKIDPKLLPELVDQEIRKRISNTAQAS